MEGEERRGAGRRGGGKEGWGRRRKRRKGLLDQVYNKCTETSKGLAENITIAELYSGIIWGQILEENEYWAEDYEL